MQIYIIVFLLEMLLGFILLGSRPSMANKKKRIIYLTISTIVLATLCGLRATSVGFDTENYAITFIRTSDSINFIFDNEQHVETGFAALCTLVKLAGGDFNVLLLICSFFTMGAANVFIYRHSPNVLLSTFILICFPFYYSSFDIIRHFISAAFFLLGYKYILEKKPIKYAAFILMGTCFHTSSLIYLLFYPLFHLTWGKRNVILIAFSGLIIMLFANYFAIYIVESTGRFEIIANEWVGLYSGGLLTAVMYITIFVIARKAAKYQEIEFNLKSRCLYIVFVLAVLSIIFIEVRIATRYIMLFAGLMSIAIPNLMNPHTALNKRANTQYLNIFIVIGLAYHMFMLLTNWQNIVPYVPYYVIPF